MPDPNLSPSDFLDSLRSAAEDDSVRTRIEIQRWLRVVEILLPAAFNAAASGNVTMKNAVHEIAPLLPRSR